MEDGKDYGSSKSSLSELFRSQSERGDVEDMALIGATTLIRYVIHANAGCRRSYRWGAVRSYMCVPTPYVYIVNPEAREPLA